MQKWFHAALSSANADGIGRCRKVGARSNRAGLDALVHAVQAECTHDSNFSRFFRRICRKHEPPYAAAGCFYRNFGVSAHALYCVRLLGSGWILLRFFVCLKVPPLGIAESVKQERFFRCYLPSKFGFLCLSVRKTFQLYSCLRFLSSLYPHQGHVKAFFNSKHFTASMFGFDASASILAVANKSTTNGETSRANKKNQI